MAPSLLSSRRPSHLLCWLVLWALISCGGTGPNAGTPSSDRADPQGKEVDVSMDNGPGAADRASTSGLAFTQSAAEPHDGAVAGSSAPMTTLPLPVGTKVLQVGDSFAGALGLPLGKMLEEQGVHSILKHKDASYLTTWAWEEDLQKFLWKFNPDLVVITVGANELEIAEPEKRERTVKKIISTIGDRPCVWVAIPLWKGEQNGLMKVIEANVSPCLYYDTNALLDVAHMPRIEDGIHPTTAARKDWADAVLAWLKEHRAPVGDKLWHLTP